MVYWLTPPTRVTFIISVVLAILALLVHYAQSQSPWSVRMSGRLCCWPI
jgi:hypothetical protein